jgi:type II secretion system protein H
MQNRRDTCRSAFTLIELILVLLLIAVIAGIVSPTLRGFSAGQKLRDTADRFVTLTRLARAQALATGQVHRVTIDTANNRCVVAAEVGQQLTEISDGMDGAFEIPEGVHIQLKDAQGMPGDYVQFYPNGRTQTASLRISMTDGESYVDVECVAPVEGFYMINPGVPR